MLDRSTIFREAHSKARKRIKWCRDVRPYRAILATCLRECWHSARLAAEEAPWEAAHPVPAEVLEEAAAMRADAWWEPITSAGNARYAAQLAATAALVDNARRASSLSLYA